MARIVSLRFLAVCCAGLVLTGCPTDDPVDPPPIDGGGGVAVQDAGSSSTDGGGSSAVDAGVAALPVQPSNALTAGGGKGENANYKVRLLIGGPTAAGAASNGSNSVKVGAGAAQNGQ